MKEVITICLDGSTVELLRQRKSATRIPISAQIELALQQSRGRP